MALQKPAETSLQVLKSFDPNSGAIILEEEVREAVIKTAGAAVGQTSYLHFDIVHSIYTMTYNSLLKYTV